MQKEENMNLEIRENQLIKEAETLLISAVKKLYPNSKIVGTSNNKNKFLCDFDTESPFNPDDLINIEKEISFSNKRKSIKLLSVSGVYLEGDEKNKMIQRIGGICFESKEQLKNYLKLQEEILKRNHKKIGKELELFFFDETAPGMPYWLPKGQKMYNTLVQFWREQHEVRGYQEFSSPLLNDSQLWKTSGHWEHYCNNMFVFSDEDGNEKALKPMSCPNAIKVYQTKTRSYRDLPLRFNDIDVIHRNEKSGELSGMFRVRMFRQDDSHNFIRQDQIASEIKEILDIANMFYGVFGLTYKVSLSTRPEKFIGDIDIWNYAESELVSVLNDVFGKENYGIKEGDGAFYGPKIDIQMKDSLGREWQMGTIQLDFQLPKRFEITYIDEEGQKQTPIILHRVIYGSIERFIGIITEHFAGAFPVWLAPVQAYVITIGNANNEKYARNVAEVLVSNKIRLETNFKQERLGHKIKYAQTQKIPYTIIIGDNEAANNIISVRSRKYGDIGNMTFDEFIRKINDEISNYSMDN